MTELDDETRDKLLTLWESLGSPETPSEADSVQASLYALALS